MDTTGEITGIQDEELNYFAEQLRKSGRYRVFETSSSPHFDADTTRVLTPTPEKVVRQLRQFDFDTESAGGARQKLLSFSPNNPFLDDKPKPVVAAVQSSFQPPVTRSDPVFDPFDSLKYTNDRKDSAFKVPKLVEFSGEKPDEFDLWLYDLKCLLRSQVYSTPIILEAIRKSLKGRARLVLLHVGESATVEDIVDELEAVYGNIHSSEKLKEKFYNARQGAGESVAEYSLRLEQILSNITLDSATKDEMLRNRLWAGLRNSELHNMSRYKYETALGFNKFRKELRQMELDMQPKQQIVEPAVQQMNVVESRLLQQMQDMTAQFKLLNTRVSNIEKDFSVIKKGQNQPNTNRNAPASPVNENKPVVGLNKNGPSSKGSR